MKEYLITILNKKEMNYLEKLQKIRKKIWIKTILTYSIIVLFTSVQFIYSITTSNIIICIFITILCGYPISKSICQNDIENYKNIFAKNITLEILKDIFEDVKYKPNDYLLPEDFARVLENAKIPTINSYDFDDYISAKYKNVQIEYSDIRMGYTSKNNDSNHSESFKGKWLVLSFDKNFKSNIQIGPKVFNGKKNNQMLKGKEYKEIKTSDFELNKKLIVYANKKDEVTNILTPSTIDAIKRLYIKTGGKLLIFVLDNQIHIGINDKKNFFEPSIYKQIDLEKEKNKIINQVKIITELIDNWI